MSSLHVCCRFSGALVAWALAALGGGAARADVADYQLERLALQGDADPVSGSIHTIFRQTGIAGGRVVFSGQNGSEDRVYGVEHGVLSVLVADGDPAAGTGGGVFSDVAQPRDAVPDALAYLGIYASQWGAFLRSGGIDSAMALPGDAAPGGGTISRVTTIHSAAPGPWVAFGADVDVGGGSPIAVHLVHGPNGLHEVYREGQPAPAAVGGVFSPVQSFWEADVAADGSVTFGALVSGGSAASGLFRASAGGAIAPLLLEGDAVTTPGGGTFTRMPQWASVNGAGDVAFDPDVLRAPATTPREAVFVLEGGAQREIAIRGDAIPGASPAAPLFSGLLGSSPPEISDAGVVVFTAILEDASQTASDRAVVVDDRGDLAVLVKAGDPVPGVPGAVFTSFTEARIDAAGRIAIEASTDVGEGVFLATKASSAVPALPGIGLLTLAAVLLASRRRIGPRRPGQALRAS
jgi:hypothetical protein